ARDALAPVQADRLVVRRGDDDVLDVEDELGDGLLDPRDGGGLVEDTADPDARDGGTRDGGQEGATQGVAEGVAEPGLQRLEDEPGALRAADLFGQELGRASVRESGLMWRG